MIQDIITKYYDKYSGFLKCPTLKSPDMVNACIQHLDVVNSFYKEHGKMLDLFQKKFAQWIIRMYEDHEEMYVIHEMESLYNEIFCPVGQKNN